MALTLGTTGMDAKTEAEVRVAFAIANDDTGGSWTLRDDDSADYLVVDMDSLYGPMSWLRLHAAGRKVIGLTSMERSQTDYRLPKPVNATQFAEVLSLIAAGAPQVSPQAPVVETAPAHSTPAPSPADHMPEPAAMRSDVTEVAPPDAPVLASLLPVAAGPEPVVQQSAAAPAPMEAAPMEAAPMEAAPMPEPVALPPDRPLTHWLQRGGLERRVRLQRNADAVLLIDPRARVYHGPATLKPLLAHFDGTLLLEDFATPDAAEWEREATALGPAQPLVRLEWLGNLLAGRGALLPGNDPDGDYRLTKWPQTEREFPKHFRIATAMMKGPATLDAIAAASGVSREEVADFVNANLATGYAELVIPEPPAPEEPPPKPAGLFGRMRGR